MLGDEISIGSFRGVHVGKGGFAAVYRVVDADGNIFALKLVDATADDAIRDSLYHEFSVQSELIHPQVVHAHAYGFHEGRPYIVLDWIGGAELFDRSDSPRADDFILMLRQLASVLLFVHHRGWVHGDLKPENFRWRNESPSGSHDPTPQLCLLDFGLARSVGDADRPRGAGTVGYCAPEFLNNLPADGRADWYSIGVILYEWIFGVRPYASDEPAIEIGGHLEGSPDFGRARIRPAPDWADEVILRLLCKNAEERADDEFALLTWLSQFDSDLEPTALLNQQLSYCAKSESVRLRGHERDLLQLLDSEMSAGQAIHWSIKSHGIVSSSWMAHAAALSSRVGYDVRLQRDEFGNCVLSERLQSDRRDARIDIHLSPNLTHNADLPASSAQRSLVLLPWDRDEVRSYVRGVVGDDDVAEAWTDTILESTCGLPAVISELLQVQIDTGRFSVDADGWGLDEVAVREWRDAHMPERIANVLGRLSAAETSLCEWLALGEGVGSIAVLRQLRGESSDDCDAEIAQLVARGFVVRDCEGRSGQFELRLRLAGHAAIIRSQMAAADVVSMSRELASTIVIHAPHPTDLRSRVLGHTWARAEDWARSAEEYLRAASLDIAADERERAMQYIVLAQDSAQKIDEAGPRRHWVGHARMVEADLQKAGGQLEVARRIYRELLGLCRQTGDQRLLAETLHDLGDLYRIVRSHAKGIRVERRALRIWESLGNRAQASRSLNSLGNFHRLSSELPLARDFYQQALAIQRELGFEQFAAVNLNNIGLTCWQEYNFADADRYFREALAIHERLNVPVEIARVLNNLGAISFVQGHLEESADSFTRAASLNASAGAQSEELYNHRNLVEVAVEQGDLRTAVSLGQQVYQASLQLGDVSTLVEVAAVLADAYMRAGDYRSARRLHSETVQRSASVKNDELRVYLDLQRVATTLAFNRNVDALSLLDTVAPVGSKLPSRYLSIEASVLRMQILASMSHDEASFTQLLTDAIAEAEAIRAPHKAAQIALVALPGITDLVQRDALVARITETTTRRPRWHWAPTFHDWRARELMAAGELDQALAVVTGSIDQLRRDGCWEKLWRALVLQAEISYAQADYEPAMAALDESSRTLKIVSSTVDDDRERFNYLDCAHARSLERIRGRITELVS